MRTLVVAGEEDTFEYTEEELEEGPEQLAVLESDEEVGGGAAWSPLFSSSNEHVKNQVRHGSRSVVGCDLYEVTALWRCMCLLPADVISSYTASWHGRWYGRT